MSSRTKPVQPSTRSRPLNRKVMDEILIGFVKQSANDLQQFATFHSAVEALQCDHRGIRHLVEISLKIHDNFAGESKKRIFTVGKGTFLDGLPYVAASVRQQLVLYHFYRGFKSKTTPEDVLQEVTQEFAAFLELIRELDEAGADTPKLFQIALTKPEISMHLAWQSWLKRFAVVKRKATEFKRRVSSHSTRVTTYKELSDGIHSAVMTEYAGTLRGLNAVIKPPHLKEWQDLYRAPGGSLRKNSEVWLPILKDLEQHLALIYKSGRHWERPGGLPGTSETVKPGIIYTTINQLLHYCYPGVWDLDAKTTASMKSRCQRVPSHTS